ncbi:hypothetical protein Cgig2_004744 [Carnegiea gigantea]|uniref:Uncharacterized protein n=1 Tax=Carnegiea gigantea TaxID=171969 RepID=A0A9Q1KXB1_9CARY|nr:hypothetical protein Cgig2_004744 [Carnegiea gigantea]
MGEQWCDLHPEQVYVGVCPLCLNERLLILAAKQDLKSSTHYKATELRIEKRLKNFHIFSFMFHELDLNELIYKLCTDGQINESFISIKFGENGEASWDKGTRNVSKVSLEHFNMAWPSQTLFNHGVNNGSSGNKNVVDHTNLWAGSLRWRKGIGHLLQVIRWRRSKKAIGGEGRGGRGVVMVN